MGIPVVTFKKQDISAIEPGINGGFNVHTFADDLWFHFETEEEAKEFQEIFDAFIYKYRRNISGAYAFSE